MPKSGLSAGEERTEGESVQGKKSDLGLEFFDITKFREDTHGMNKDEKLAHLQRNIDALVTLASTKGIHLDEDLLSKGGILSLSKVGVINEDKEGLSGSPYSARSWVAEVEEKEEEELRSISSSFPDNSPAKIPAILPEKAHFLAKDSRGPAIIDDEKRMKTLEGKKLAGKETPVKFLITGNTIPAAAMGGPAIRDPKSGHHPLVEGKLDSKIKSHVPSSCFKSCQGTSITSSLTFHPFSPQNTSFLSHTSSNSNLPLNGSPLFPPLDKDQSTNPLLFDQAPNFGHDTTKTLTPSHSFVTGQSQPLTSQPLLLFSQTLTPSNNVPNPNHTLAGSTTLSRTKPVHKTGLTFPGFSGSCANSGSPDPLLAVLPKPSRLGSSKKSWSSIVQVSTQRMSLNFVKPSINEEGTLTLGKGTSTEGELRWKNTLIGYSIGRRIPLKLVDQRAMAIWGKLGLKEVRVNKEGFFFFSFQEEDGVKVVLSKGPWNFYGQQMFIKPWTRNFECCKEEFKTAPNWIKLFGIPTAYWTSTGISAIASIVGVPLYADDITSSATILEFARICVEMKVDGDFPLSFMVQTEHKETFEVRVEYGWKTQASGSSTKPILAPPPKSAPFGHDVAQSEEVVMPRQVNEPKPPTGSIATKPFQALSSLENEVELKDVGGMLKMDHNTKSMEEELSIEAMEEGEVEEVAISLGGEVAQIKGKEFGLHSPIGLELKINSDEEGDWTPIPWGKKRIIVDEFDKRRVRKSKGKGKKGSRIT